MTTADTTVSTLIQKLDDATRDVDTAAICRQVKSVLVDSMAAGSLDLPSAFTQTSAQGYARRLLHAGDRYAVVVMVWDAGQGTPIHDHDGLWCVECVYAGTIQVESYDLQGSPEDEEVGFRPAGVVRAGRGEAGSLIPPFDYHVIRNPNDEVAVTIHVYGGEMDGCHVYEEASDGRYRRLRKELCYTA